jgi:hypothetical protein
MIKFKNLRPLDFLFTPLQNQNFTQHYLTHADVLDELLTSDNINRSHDVKRILTSLRDDYSSDNMPELNDSFVHSSEILNRSIRIASKELEDSSLSNLLSNRHDIISDACSHMRLESSTLQLGKIFLKHNSGTKYYINESLNFDVVVKNAATLFTSSENGAVNLDIMLSNSFCGGSELLCFLTVAPKILIVVGVVQFFHLVYPYCLFHKGNFSTLLIEVRKYITIKSSAVLPRFLRVYLPNIFVAVSASIITTLSLYANGFLVVYGPTNLIDLNAGKVINSGIVEDYVTLPQVVNSLVRAYGSICSSLTRHFLVGVLDGASENLKNFIEKIKSL